MLSQLNLTLDLVLTQLNLTLDLVLTQLNLPLDLVLSQEADCLGNIKTQISQSILVLILGKTFLTCLFPSPFRAHVVKIYLRSRRGGGSYQRLTRDWSVLTPFKTLAPWDWVRWAFPCLSNTHRRTD